jgi:hypothetical protein
MDVSTTAFRIVRHLTEKQDDTHRTITARAAGRVGGAARAERLSATERHNIAVKANRARQDKREASRIP